MGCDIHTYLEIQDSKGNWIYSDLHNPKGEKIEVAGHRNYRVFGLLGNVRFDPNSIGLPPLTDARGLPDDVSPEVSKENEGWGYDAHSHSYVTLDEISDYRIKHADKENDILIYVEDTLRSLLPILLPYVDKPESKLRMVFWFDN